MKIKNSTKKRKENSYNLNYVTFKRKTMITPIHRLPSN